MKWALCGMAAAAILKCVAKKPFGKLLVVNLGLELAKQAALKMFSNEIGVMDWEFGLVSGGAVIEQAFDDQLNSWFYVASLDEGSLPF